MLKNIIPNIALKSSTKPKSYQGQVRKHQNLHWYFKWQIIVDIDVDVELSYHLH